jgi:hypothetical protein
MLKCSDPVHFDYPDGIHENEILRARAVAREALATARQQQN